MYAAFNQHVHTICYRNDVVGNMPGVSLLKGWLERSHFSPGSFCLCGGSGCDEPEPALVHTAAQGTVQIAVAWLWCTGRSPGSAQGCSSAASAPGDTASEGKEALRAVSTAASWASSRAIFVFLVCGSTELQRFFNCDVLCGKIHRERDLIYLVVRDPLRVSLMHQRCPRISLFLIFDNLLPDRKVIQAPYCPTMSFISLSSQAVQPVVPKLVASEVVEALEKVAYVQRWCLFVTTRKSYGTMTWMMKTL